MKRLGPELKMPEPEGPAVPRRTSTTTCANAGLLPLVALVVVAIVAVPFLLGGGSDEEEADAPAAGASASRRGALEAASATSPWSRRSPACATTASGSPTAGRPTPSSSASPRPVLKGAEAEPADRRPHRARPPSTSTTESSTADTAKRLAAGRPPTERRRAAAGQAGTSPSSPSRSTCGSRSPATARPRTPARPIQPGGNDRGSGSRARAEVGNGGQAPVLPLTPLPGDEGAGRHLHGALEEAARPLFLVSSDVTVGLRRNEVRLRRPAVCQLIEVEPRLPGHLRLRRKRSPLQDQRARRSNRSSPGTADRGLAPGQNFSK